MLNAKWQGTPARVHFVAEYYDEDKWSFEFLKSIGIHQKPDVQSATRYDIHDDYHYEALVALTDPKLVRAEQRMKAKKFSINGVEIGSVATLIENGRQASRSIARRSPPTRSARRSRRRDESAVSRPSRHALRRANSTEVSHARRRLRRFLAAARIKRLRHPGQPDRTAVQANESRAIATLRAMLSAEIVYSVNNGKCVRQTRVPGLTESLQSAGPRSCRISMRRQLRAVSGMGIAWSSMPARRPPKPPVVLTARVSSTFAVRRHAGHARLDGHQDASVSTSR